MSSHTCGSQNSVFVLRDRIKVNPILTNYWVIKRVQKKRWRLNFWYSVSATSFVIFLSGNLMIKDQSLIDSINFWELSCIFFNGLNQIDIKVVFKLFHKLFVFRMALKLTFKIVSKNNIVKPTKGIDYIFEDFIKSHGRLQTDRSIK